jgi:pseudouridine-5'-phosphate glycosidase/pseudouridine kinase
MVSTPVAARKESTSDASSIVSELPSTPATSISSSEGAPSENLVVAGALAVDFSCDYAPFPTSTSQIEPLPHTSNPAMISQSLGGVAHNIAKAVHLLGGSVRLHSAVGEDLSGRAALSQLEDEGMAISGIQVLAKPARTAQYVAVNNANKDLALAMADMSILEAIPQHSITDLATPLFADSPKIFVADANWSSAALHTWLQAARHSPSTTTIFEPVSTAKALRIFPTNTTSTVFPAPLVDIITPNTYELTALHDFAAHSSHFEHPSWFTVIDALGIPPTGLRVPLAMTTNSEIVDQGIPQQAIKLLPFFPTILTKLGPQGVLMVKLLEADAEELHDDNERQYVLARNMNGDEKIGGLYVRLFLPERILAPEEVVSVNGIGDTFCGALAVGLANGSRIQHVVDFAQRAAGLSLKSRESVSSELRGLRGEVSKLKA